VQFRRLMLDAVSSFAQDGLVIGLGDPHIPHVHIQSFEGVVSKSTDWRTLGVSEAELALIMEESDHVAA
jgi:phthalate 4,5-dioxygenase